jgi:DNA-directed RNA polymerase specialized sigma24 family protein
MTTPSPRTARHATDGELSARFQCDMKPLREPLDCRAMRMTRNHADAEDLLQDTLVKAYAYLWQGAAGEPTGTHLVPARNRPRDR